jgi:hypothetical protein
MYGGGFMLDGIAGGETLVADALLLLKKTVLAVILFIHQLQTSSSR